MGRKPLALPAEALALIAAHEVAPGAPAAVNGHVVDHLPVATVYAAASNGSSGGHNGTSNGAVASSLVVDALTHETNGHNVSGETEFLPKKLGF